MSNDNDKTQTHVISIKGNEVGCYLSSLIVVASLFLLATAVRADDSPPDSALAPISPLVVQLEKPSGDTSHFSYGISGIATIESEDISNGFGFGISGFFNGFLPLVPRAGMNLVISKLDVEGLPDAEFIIFSPSLDLTLRGSIGRLRPYAGAGINLHFNHLILDEPADVSISGYDSTTQARQIDMGWGVTPHLRLGLIISVGKRTSLLMEGRFMSTSHTADINYRDRYTGDEWTGTVDYNMPSVWFSLGIIRDP